MSKCFVDIDLVYTNKLFSLGSSNEETREKKFNMEAVCLILADSLSRDF